MPASRPSWPRRSAPIDWTQPDFGDLQVAAIGVPMDLGVTNRNGARFGPRAVRTIERIGPYNHVLECAPVFDLRLADIGDVPFRSRFSLDASHEDIERAYPHDRRGGRGAALGRRRPFDDAADPARRRARTARSAWSISTRIATRPAPTR